MKYQFRVAAFVAMCFTVSVLSSCSKNDDPDTTVPPDNTPKGTSVMIATSATFGKVLTDSLGKTLYFFSTDADGKSSCTGGCIAAWPVFYKETLSIDSTLTAADFGVITRTDGSKQNTYKGWPLYYYAGDAKAGDITGDKANDIWFVAKPDYSVMVAKFQLTGNNGVQYKSDLTPGTEATAFITDAYGRTLYGFAPDKNGKNTYTKEDFSNNATWPIYEIAEIQNVPSVLAKSDFTKVTVFTKTQLAYKGWPVYYFGPDQQIRGNTKGVSVPSPGVWPYLYTTTAVAPLP
jgi:predicted lipoprotein with Yx(FWY)xxD motif